MVTPIFYGRVLPGGLLVLDQPKAYAAIVRSLKGKHIEVTIRKRKAQRSSKANRFYFGCVIPLIAEQCGYEKDEMHELLAMKFLRIQDDPITGAPRRQHTPETDSKEFAEYVDRCIRFAAVELGIVIPEPGEVAA